MPSNYDEWNPREAELYADLIAGNINGLHDPHLQDLFDRALFDPEVTREERLQLYDELVAYMWDEYGVDFEEIFDWEDYREYYEAAQAS